MKKLTLIAALLSLASVAKAADTLDGCGLGWQVTDKKTYTATTTRATTNAFVPPTFGMTTGTLGCNQLEVGQVDKEAANYVATNYEALKSELALGAGEHVSAMSTAFGCGSKASEIGAQIQQNYENTVAPATTATELFYNIKAQVAEVCS